MVSCLARQSPPFNNAAHTNRERSSPVQRRGPADPPAANKSPASTYSFATRQALVWAAGVRAGWRGARGGTSGGPGSVQSIKGSARRAAAARIGK
jgi:hypothetical protein